MKKNRIGILTVCFGAMSIVGCITKNERVEEPLNQPAVVDAANDATGATTVTALGPMRHFEDCKPEDRLNVANISKGPTVELGVSTEALHFNPVLYSRYACP